jgi:hypothetical protein
MNLFVHLKGCYDSARKLVRFNCFARNKGDNSDSEKYILFLFQWRMDSFPMKATSQIIKDYLYLNVFLNMIYNRT